MKFVGPWTVHDVLWLAETNWKSQNLRLLFIKQYINSNHSTQKAQKCMEKKKKKRENADANALSKRSLGMKSQMEISCFIAIFFEEK